MLLITALVTILFLGNKANGQEGNFETSFSKCNEKYLDFSDFSPGDYITQDHLDEAGFDEVSISIDIPDNNGRCVTDFPRIFDSANPTCGDNDLRSSSDEKVLIIQENKDCAEPDDCAGGGRIVFDFSVNVNMKHIRLLDMDESVTLIIETGDGDEQTMETEKLSNGKHTTQEISVEGVKKMTVVFEGSGAIGEVVYEICNSGANGDPHFQTWLGEKFDYHGQCDLVLMSAPQFAGVGLDIHVRTTQQDFYSYISGVAIKIGSDILEVERDNVYINGDSKALSPNEQFRVGEYTARFADVPTKVGRPQKVYTIITPHREAIVVKVFDALMAVRVHGATGSNFKNTQGITGHYNSGNLYARDGVTLIEDVNDYGQEWQVGSDDPQLFREVQMPQFPERCLVADPSKTRKLRHGISREQAQQACTHGGVDIENCVFDIMATGDLSIVGAHL